MKLTIREKIEKIFNKEKIREKIFLKEKYNYSFPIKKHLSIFSISIVYILIPTIFNIGEQDVSLLSILYILGAFFAVSSLFFYSFSFIFSILDKVNIFKYQKEKLIIEKELDNEFGSVDRAIFIYNEVSEIGLEFTNENFYKILNEPIDLSFKRNKLKVYKDDQIKKIDEKIEKLLKDKEHINEKINKKQESLLNKKKQIAFNKIKDVSIPVSEALKIRS